MLSVLVSWLNLTQSFVLFFQLSVLATDLGKPNALQSSNRATVNVDVIRNENAPIFFSSTYEASIRQDIAVTTTITTVSASDEDTAVSGRLAAIIS